MLLESIEDDVLVNMYMDVLLEIPFSHFATIGIGFNVLFCHCHHVVDIVYTM